MTFADNLVRLRREKGFSQEQLADLMDVSRQAVSKWEAGQTMPDLPKLVALADLFGTSLDALVRPEAVVETKPGGTVQVVTAGQTVCVPAGATVNVVPGYEYKSKHTLLGLPLCTSTAAMACGVQKASSPSAILPRASSRWGDLAWAL